MGKTKFMVTDQAKRPASPADKCFYCQSPVGDFHDERCVLVLRKVRLSVTFVVDADVPAFWEVDDIEFHRNESSWCQSNILEDISAQFPDDDECLCGRITIGVDSMSEDVYLGER